MKCSTKSAAVAVDAAVRYVNATPRYALLPPSAFCASRPQPASLRVALSMSAIPLRYGGSLWRRYAACRKQMLLRRRRDIRFERDELQVTR